MTDTFVVRGASVLDESGSFEGPLDVHVELLFEVPSTGRAHVVSPTQGVAAMAKSDIVSWGLFGVAVGVIAGLTGGTTLGFLEKGVATGIAWVIFGLVAGALYGLWAGRAVSAPAIRCAWRRKWLCTGTKSTPQLIPMKPTWVGS